MRLATTSARWPFDPDQWTAWLSEDRLAPFFVTRQGYDIGHFALRARGPNRHLSWVLVRASQRGGVGRDLLDHACAASRDLGAQQLTLNVMMSNARAHHLYQSYGFVPLSETDGKVHMGLDLSC